MKKALTLILSSLFAMAASAVPAHSGTFTFKQSDGTVLTLRMVGDEFCHYYVDVNTGRKMLRHDGGDFYVASASEFARFVAAGDELRAFSNKQRMQRLPKSPTAARDKEKSVGAQKSASSRVGSFNNNLKGQRKGLVILANFSDVEHSIPNAREEWNAAFNEVGYHKNGHIGSVRDYFHDQSYGDLDLQFDIIGPVTVSNTSAYYGTNNSYGNDRYAARMVAEACILADEFVNYADYDWDGDGEVDQVYVVYAGHSESFGNNDSNLIWPHESMLSYSELQQTFDGVKVDTYACSSEYAGPQKEKIMNGIGTACHEFSHCIGFPDIYDPDYSGAFAMGALDILSSGSYNGPNNNGEVPCGYTAYERWMAGWLEPKVLSEGCKVENMPAINDEREAYVMYNDAKPTEYFLLENRKCEGWFRYSGTFISGHGLLVSHINYNEKVWESNAVNDNPDRQCMNIVPAAKTFGTYYREYRMWDTSAADYHSMFYPGTKEVTELTDDTHYNYGLKLFNRQADLTYKLGKPITDIKENSADGAISFVFCGGPDDGNRWTVTFDAGTGTTSATSWTQTSNGEGIVLPEATPGYDGWRFLGWTPSYVSEGTERPSEILPAGNVYKPSADINLYALYACSTDGPLRDEYHCVANQQPVDGGRYVLLSKNADEGTNVYALDAATLIVGSYQRSSVGKQVEVDFSTSVPTLFDPESSMVWTASLVEDDHFCLTSNEGYYLSVNGTSGMALVNDVSVLGWDAQYGLAGRSGEISRYFAHVSDTSGNITYNTTKSETMRLYLYLLCDYSDKKVVYATAPDYSAEYAAVGSVVVEDAPALYDLQGRRLGQYPQGQGLYVKNGRVVLK